MRWTRGRNEIEMSNEPLYAFGSSDNQRSFGQEILLESEYQPSSTHSVGSFLDGTPVGSVVVGASGGGTGVNEHSCVLLEDRCLVAVGDRIAALALPHLGLLWQVQGDDATCFGLHLTLEERHVVVHGELSISKYTMDGKKVWEFSGKDIFTGACGIHEGAVVVKDFNNDEYSIDLESGSGKIVGVV